MASNAFLGFTKGFFETQNQMIDKEQERRDKIGDAIIAMQLKGAEKRISAYEERKQAWKVINQMKADNPQLAMIKWAETIPGIDTENLNQDVLSKYSNDELKTALDNSYNAWKAGPVPTITEEDTTAPHMRRAADDNSVGIFIKDMFGINSDEIPYTPYAGVKNLTKEQAVGIAEKEQMDRLMAQESVGVEVEGGPAKFLELKPAKTNKPKIDFTNYEDPVTGITYRVGRMYNSKTGEFLGKTSSFPVEYPSEPKALTSTQQQVVYGIYNDIKRSFEVSEEKDKQEFARVLEEGVGKVDAQTGEWKGTGPLRPYFLKMMEKYRRLPGQSPANSSQFAVEELYTAWNIGMIDKGDDGWLGFGGSDPSVSPIDGLNKIESAVDRDMISPEMGLNLIQTFYPNQWQAMSGTR